MAMGTKHKKFGKVQLHSFRVMRADRETDERTDEWTDRQTDRQTEILITIAVQ